MEDQLSRWVTARVAIAGMRLVRLRTTSFRLANGQRKVYSECADDIPAATAAPESDLMISETRDRGLDLFERWVCEFTAEKSRRVLIRLVLRHGESASVVGPALGFTSANARCIVHRFRRRYLPDAKSGTRVH